MADKSTAAARIAAALARRAKLQAVEADAFAEQQANDIERMVELEEEHGFERVQRLDIGGWKPGVGAATMVVVRIPTSSERVFKRYQDTAAKAKDGSTTRTDAVVTLGASCIVYPHRDTDKALHDATIELAPGIIGHAGAAVINTVQGNAEEEKKG